MQHVPHKELVANATFGAPQQSYFANSVYTPTSLVLYNTHTGSTLYTAGLYKTKAKLLALQTTLITATNSKKQETFTIALHK